MRICLEMPENATPKLCARLTYAFRLFCTIYGHQPIIGQTVTVEADVILRYRTLLSATGSACDRVIWLSRTYVARDLNLPAPAPIKYSDRVVSTLLHAAPIGEDAPDWLGEIFEWVSCADEYSVTERDSVGRALFSATYAGRHRLDMGVPYAAIAMQSLQREICRAVLQTTINPRPWGDVSGHVVIPTHDVDYFPLRRIQAVNRLARNAAISFLMNKQPALAFRQARMAASTTLGYGSDPLDRISTLATEERRRGIRASYYFLAKHGHSRDAHYALENPGVVTTMRWLKSYDMEVGVHGTYTCLNEPDGLSRELSYFHARDFCPQGGRQHWLRYTLDRLIPAIERAGLAYDTSIGWSTVAGFRAGACFAFPPYNFAEERAANFIEIPMLMMDQAFCTSSADAEEMFEKAASLLAQSRRFGLGGVSLLWHPTAFGEGWLPRYAGDIYWRLADQRAAWGDAWMPAQEFLTVARQRYVETGLLPAEKPAQTAEITSQFN